MSAANIQTYVEKLVSFGTRQTLSSTTDPNRGIGAARDYIFNTLQGFAAASGGRMTVEKQTFIQPASPNPNDRIPRDTEITNVIATLKGAQPESTNRVYVVGGHYDSRCTGAIDAECDAPGAEDDGSGVAAMMEMARVMATHSFDATIKFMAVAGEERCGSRSRTRTSTTSTRTCAPRAGCSSATCRSSWTSTSTTAWRA